MTNKNNPTLPKHIHMIWLGGQIRREDYQHMLLLALAAKRSGFTLNLWVDHLSNYEKACNAEGLAVPGLKLHQIDALYQDLRQSEFYSKNRYGMSLFECFCRAELVGARNYAAASDWLRYEILRRYGGYYMDMDTRFEDLSQLKLQVDEVGESGFKLFEVDYGDTGNALLGSVPNGRLITQICKTVENNYVFKAHNPVPPFYYQYIGKFLGMSEEHWPRLGKLQQQDLRRLHLSAELDTGSVIVQFLKLQATVMLTGPSMLFSLLLGEAANSRQRILSSNFYQCKRVLGVSLAPYEPGSSWVQVSSTSDAATRPAQRLSGPYTDDDRDSRSGRLRFFNPRASDATATAAAMESRVEPTHENKFI